MKNIKGKLVDKGSFNSIMMEDFEYYKDVILNNKRELEFEIYERPYIVNGYNIGDTFNNFYIRDVETNEAKKFYSTDVGVNKIHRVGKRELLNFINKLEENK